MQQQEDAMDNLSKTITLRLNRFRPLRFKDAISVVSNADLGPLYEASMQKFIMKLPWKLELYQTWRDCVHG